MENSIGLKRIKPSGVCFKVLSFFQQLFSPIKMFICLITLFYSLFLERVQIFQINIYINTFMPNRISHPYQLDASILNLGLLGS